MLFKAMLYISISAFSEVLKKTRHIFTNRKIQILAECHCSTVHQNDAVQLILLKQSK